MLIPLGVPPRDLRDRRKYMGFINGREQACKSILVIDTRGPRWNKITQLDTMTMEMTVKMVVTMINTTTLVKANV